MIEALRTCESNTMTQNDTNDGGKDRQLHDYDVDDRFAHIRVDLLGKEFTDVVRVCEKFPGLPDGITVYVEHVDAVDLRRENKAGEDLTERKRGAMEALTALLYETHATTTQNDMLLAAFTTPRLSDELVHRARDEYQEMVDEPTSN